VGSTLRRRQRGGVKGGGQEESWFRVSKGGIGRPGKESLRESLEKKKASSRIHIFSGKIEGPSPTELQRERLVVGSEPRKKNLSDGKKGGESLSSQKTSSIKGIRNNR